MDAALKSSCTRSRCGAAIILNDIIIATGANITPDGAPPTCIKDISRNKKYSTDEHCCIHAEQVAIIRALRHRIDISGATLFFARLDREGNHIPAGELKCTTCSKLALFAGIKNWVLYMRAGTFGNDENTYMEFDAVEYNRISFLKVYSEAIENGGNNQHPHVKTKGIVK